MILVSYCFFFLPLFHWPHSKNFFSQISTKNAQPCFSFNNTYFLFFLFFQSKSLLFLHLLYKANLAYSSVACPDVGLLKAGAHFNIYGHRDPLPDYKRILGMSSCAISLVFLFINLKIWAVLLPIRITSECEQAGTIFLYYTEMVLKWLH